MEKVLITGSTDGIGKETAIRLAGRGYYVIIHGRNRERCLQTYYEARNAGSGDHVDFIEAELSSQEEVKGMADKIIDRHRDINIIINNACELTSKKKITDEDVERNFAVNYLSRFLLVEVLINSKQTQAIEQVLNISGPVSSKTKIQLDNINLTKKHKPGMAHAQARLANLLYIFKMARIYENKEIRFNMLYPGKVKSGYLKKDPDASFLRKWAYKINSPFYKKPYKAAINIINMLHNEQLSQLHGQYITGGKTEKTTYDNRSHEMQDKLFDLSKKLTGLGQ